MIGPTSPLLLALLACAALVALGLAIARSSLAVRIPMAVLAVVLPFILGIAAVNAYYGYYRDWHGLVVGLQGTPEPGLSALAAPGPAPAATHAEHQVGDAVAGVPGKVVQVRLAGAASGIARGGYFYVPPEYGDARFTGAGLPIVELLHGTPGRPADWITALHVGRVMDQLRAARRIGPMILVMPNSNGPISGHEECVNAVGGPADDTYISRDVPADTRALLHLPAPAGRVGLAGYSSGGYCAVNLAVRHAPQFATAASLDGYFSPAQGGYARALFKGDRAAERANDPVAQVGYLTASRVPAFFLAAGTAGGGDLTAARQFARTVPLAHPVRFVTENHARHDFAAWQAVLPTTLTWLWQQLSTPALRAACPTTGAQSALPTVLTVPVAAPTPRHRRHPGAGAVPTARPSTVTAPIRPTPSATPTHIGPPGTRSAAPHPTPAASSPPPTG